MGKWTPGGPGRPPKITEPPPGPTATAEPAPSSEIRPETEEDVYVGKIVLFKMPEGPGQGQLRPAIVVDFVEEDMRSAVSLKVLIHESADSMAMTFYDWVRRGSRLGEWQPLVKYNWKLRKDLPRPE